MHYKKHGKTVQRLKTFEVYIPYIDTIVSEMRKVMFPHSQGSIQWPFMSLLWTLIHATCAYVANTHARAQ